MERSMGGSLLVSLFLLVIILLTKDASGEIQQKEAKQMEEIKEQNKSDLWPLMPIYKPENLIRYGYFTGAKIDPDPDQIATSNDKRASSSKKINYANNMRPFQQLGHYSRSLIRQMHQQKQQERIARKPTPLLPSPAPLLYNNHRLAPLTPMALSSPSAADHVNVDDSKRTVFLSTGWAPSGLSEVRSEVQQISDGQDGAEKKKPSANSYAFTSNHWGPMGKRQDGGGGVRQLQADIFANKENFDDYNDDNRNWVDISYDIPQIVMGKDTVPLVEIESDEALRPIVAFAPETGGGLQAKMPYDLLKVKPFVIAETKRAKQKHRMNAILPSKLFNFYKYGNDQLGNRYTGASNMNK